MQYRLTQEELDRLKPSTEAVEAEVKRRVAEVRSRLATNVSDWVRKYGIDCERPELHRLASAISDAFEKSVAP